VALLDEIRDGHPDARYCYAQTPVDPADPALSTARLCDPMGVLIPGAENSRNYAVCDIRYPLPGGPDACSYRDGFIADRVAFAPHAGFDEETGYDGRLRPAISKDRLCEQPGTDTPLSFSYFTNPSSLELDQKWIVTVARQL